MRYKATHRNHVWSYDFVTERTEDGRQLKLLVVIDEFTRECLAIEPARSFRAREVILALQYLFAVRGAPEHIRSDNGLEFVAKQIQRWLDRAAVQTLYIQKWYLSPAMSKAKGEPSGVSECSDACLVE